MRCPLPQHNNRTFASRSRLSLLRPTTGGGDNPRPSLHRRGPALPQPERRPVRRQRDLRGLLRVRPAAGSDPGVRARRCRFHSVERRERRGSASCRLDISAYLADIASPFFSRARRRRERLERAFGALSALSVTLLLVVVVICVRLISARRRKHAHVSLRQSENNHGSRCFALFPPVALTAGRPSQ